MQKKRPRLKSSIYKKIQANKDPSGAKNNAAFARKTQKQREKGIQKWWYQYGGELFLRWSLKYYRTHKGKKLSLENPWFAPFMKTMGNPWLVRLLVLKGAQMGYTEATIALISFILVVLRSSCIFCVEQNKKLTDLVSPRFFPSFEGIEPIQELRQQTQDILKRTDTRSRQRLIEVGAIPVYFAYAGVASSVTKDPMKRQVSSSLSSVPVDAAVIADEIEAYPSGAIDVLYERTNASDLPTCPMRFGSTPGGSGGIVDIEKKKSIYDFDWFIRCPHCGDEQFLDVFGNLFLPRQIGDEEEQYIDEIGNPIDWHAKEKTSIQRKIETSYLGCKNCYKEISTNTIENGEYRCRKTGKKLEQLNKETLENHYCVYENICINMPRLASKNFSTSQRIARIKRSSNKVDGWQQGFGLIISLSGGRIPWEKIYKCIEELPEQYQDEHPDLVVMGVDQGVEHHWGVVQYWWWDYEAAKELQQLRIQGEEKTGQQEWNRDLWVTAIKKTVFFGPIWGRDGIEHAAKQWKCDFVGIDVEPETELSSVLARRYKPNRENSEGQIPILCQRGREQRKKNETDNDYFSKYGIIFPCDEVYLIAQDFRRQKREIQGEEVNIFSIDRTVSLDAVRSRIYNRRCFFPLEWKESDLTDKDNYFYQLQTSERFIDKDKDRAMWRAGNGEPDHAHHAEAFAEMAALLWNFVPTNNPFSFSSL